MDLKEITTALDQLDLSKYELIKKEEIADIHSAGLLLKHKKSGARVVVLSNDDENKVFPSALRHRRLTIRDFSTLWNIPHCAAPENIRSKTRLWNCARAH